MQILNLHALQYFGIAVLLASSLGGCAVYGPPYAYDPYPAYGYPSYIGPPLMLDFGFDYFSGHRHHHGDHHGWGSYHRGWSGHGGGHHRGGWGHGRGRGRH